jgi:nucleotide-binding universal stress UspA family protein
LNLHRLTLWRKFIKILLALDLSSATDAVLVGFRNLFPGPQTQLTLLHVAAPDPEFIGYDPGPQTVRDQVAGECHESHQRIQSLAQDLEKHGYEAEALQVQGAYADCILSMSRKTKADLIVMGSHGHGAMHHLLMGSTCEQVLKKSECPVLIITIRE